MARRGGVKRREAWRGPWLVHFFRRHAADDATRAVPARDFFATCPTPVRAKLAAIVSAVASAPPPAFAGGGKWEAMHGAMHGIYEARTDGPDRAHFRLFCVLERHGADVGLRGPSVVLITGMQKPFRTIFSDRDYERVRALVAEFLARVPRSVD